MIEKQIGRQVELWVHIEQTVQNYLIHEQDEGHITEEVRQSMRADLATFIGTTIEALGTALYSELQ